MSIFDVVGAAIDDVTGFPGNVANKFGPASKGIWDLNQGSFVDDTGRETTFFYADTSRDDRDKRTSLSQVTDGGGRRLAIYEYPYRDGQAVEDLGRRGERFNFEIKFFGDNYRSKFNEFIKNVADRKSKGTLIHPVRGAIVARFQEWEFIHRHDEWNAVSIRATFIEDSLGNLAGVMNANATSINMSLRAALQAITNAQAFVSARIYNLSAALLLPAAIRDSLLGRLNSIGGLLARLLGQIAVTFASDAAIRDWALKSQGQVNAFLNLYSGIISNFGTGGTPPVFQVGYSPSDQEKINQSMSGFTDANLITPQQALYAANDARSNISDAVTDIRNYFGNDGYDIELSYRDMAIQIQLAVEAAISSANALIKTYVVPYPMSLRMVAFKNGLDKDRQNEIEQMNPYLPSLNLIPAGTSLIVPTA